MSDDVVYIDHQAVNTTSILPSGKWFICPVVISYDIPESQILDLGITHIINFGQKKVANRSTDMEYIEFPIPEEKLLSYLREIVDTSETVHSKRTRIAYIIDTIIKISNNRLFRLLLAGSSRCWGVAILAYLAYIGDSTLPGFRIRLKLCETISQRYLDVVWAEDFLEDSEEVGYDVGLKSFVPQSSPSPHLRISETALRLVSPPLSPSHHVSYAAHRSSTTFSRVAPTTKDFLRWEFWQKFPFIGLHYICDICIPHCSPYPLHTEKNIRNIFFLLFPTGNGQYM